MGSAESPPCLHTAESPPCLHTALESPPCLHTALVLLVVTKTPSSALVPTEVLLAANILLLPVQWADMVLSKPSLVPQIWVSSPILAVYLPCLPSPILTVYLPCLPSKSYF